jgi:ERCC4-type nuclease
VNPAVAELTPILVDPRVGSGEFAPILEKLGVRAELAMLEAADFSISGRAADGSTACVGIERKTIADFLTSCLSGRLSGEQLPKLAENYDVVYLLLEGRCARGSDGELLIEHHGRIQTVPWGFKVWTYDELLGRILTLSQRAGLQFLRTESATESANAVVATYWWWIKGEGAHTSHLQMHKPRLVASNPLGDIVPKTPEEKQKAQVALTASTLPGVGQSRAEAAAEVFPSIATMVMADEDAWKAVPGVGKGTAKKVVSAIWGY